MNEAIVDLKSVTKTYRRGREPVEVLEDLDLQIDAGAFAALMGPSGSGKTTLLNLIGGLDQPTAGEIHVGGMRIDRLGSRALAQWRSNHVGFIFQFYNLMPVLTARQNVELPLLLKKMSSQGAQRPRAHGARDRGSVRPRQAPPARVVGRPGTARGDRSCDRGGSRSVACR